MKPLALLSALILSSAVAQAADSFKMPKGLDVLLPVQGELTDVVTAMPPVAPGSGIRVEAVSQATLTFRLSGCANTLGPVTVQKNYGNDGKLVLNVSAFEVLDPESFRIDCALKTVDLKVWLGMGFISKENVVVRFADAPAKFQFPAGTNTLRLVKGELAGLTEMLPPIAPGSDVEPIPATEATLVFKLSGCLNKLGPVAVTKTFLPNGKVQLDVSAYEIMNPKSTRVLCFAMPMASAKVFIGMGHFEKENVEVRFADYLTSSAVTK